MAETYEVANDSIDKRNDVDDKPQLSKFWLGEIAAAKKRDLSWHRRADKVIARYRDERSLDRGSQSERRANILWSNTETLKSTLFQGLGNPDVRRRFNKKGQDDKAARQAALVLERGLAYCADAYDAESQIEACIEDELLPGRGTGWLVYDAEVNEYADPEAEKPGEDAPAEATPEIAHQTVRIEHVFFKDFLTSAGRKWSDVWWCARGHDYSRDELKRYFPKHAEEIPLNVSVAGYDTPKKGGKEEEDTFKRARIWEIWDKSKKQRVYVAEEYDLCLQIDEDPYKLKDFFPTVEPLYGVKTTSSLTPIPEYTLYQDQAEELDILQTRLSRITEALKRRGLYDASMEGSEQNLSQLAFAGDNEFVPVRNFAALMEKGGLANVFQAEDLTHLVTVLDKLSMREQLLLQKIYEITGISDIIRGASNPNETATAQKIKGQFGSLRLQKRQKRIQTFVRDLFRLKAEIMAEHFTRDQLAAMTGIDMPLKAEQDRAKLQLQMIQQQQQQAQQMAQQGAGAVAAPQIDPKVMQHLMLTAKAVTWEEIASILRSDQRRGYKIDIETDATNALDSEVEKQQRIEFMTAMTGFMEKVLPAMQQMPELAPAFVPLAKENAMFTVGAFKAGRTMEEAYEDSFDQIEQIMKAALAKGPQPSPEEKKLQLEAQSKQMEFQFKAKEAEQDRALKQQEFEHSAKLKEAEFQHQTRLEEFKAAQQAQIEQQKMAQDAQLRQMEFEANQARMAQDYELNQQKFAFDQHSTAQKMDFERERHGQEMDFKRSAAEQDYTLKAFGAGQKAELDQAKLAQDGETKMAAIEAKGGGEAGQPSRGTLRNPIGEMVQAQQQSILQLGEMFAMALERMAQQMAEQTAQMVRVASAPRELVKDPRTGAKRVQVVMQ